LQLPASTSQGSQHFSRDSQRPMHPGSATASAPTAAPTVSVPASAHQLGGGGLPGKPSSTGPTVSSGDYGGRPDSLLASLGPQLTALTAGLAGGGASMTGLGSGLGSNVGSGLHGGICGGFGGGLGSMSSGLGGGLRGSSYGGLGNVGGLAGGGGLGSGGLGSAGVAGGSLLSQAGSDASFRGLCSLRALGTGNLMGHGSWAGAKNNTLNGNDNVAGLQHLLEAAQRQQNEESGQDMNPRPDGVSSQERQKRQRVRGASGSMRDGF